MNSKKTRRRTVLQTLGSLGIALLAAPSTVAARSEDAHGRCEGVARRRQPENGEALASRPDTFVAVVDRTVGDLAVLLLEADGEVVDQLIVPAEELPSVEERDVLLVTVEDDELDDVRPLVGETERRKRWSEDRIECLTG